MVALTFARAASFPLGGQADVEDVCHEIFVSRIRLGPWNIVRPR